MKVYNIKHSYTFTTAAGKVPWYLQAEPKNEVVRIWKALEREKVYKPLSTYMRAEDLPDDPVPRCGYRCFSTKWIYDLWDKEDPFLTCCLIHDIEYKLKRKEKKDVDTEFHTCCLLRAGKSKSLRKQANTYYYTVKALGWMFW